jgi:predicted nucleotide-binding protein (sugar kinase/HSP70/actin superfamily)
MTSRKESESESQENTSEEESQEESQKEPEVDSVDEYLRSSSDEESDNEYYDLLDLTPEERQKHKIQRWYDKCCRRVESLETESAESCYNRRRDSIREKARYYAELEDRYDAAIAGLDFIIDRMKAIGLDTSEGTRLINGSYW